MNEIYAEFYQDSAGRTRWRLVALHAGDKDTLADSGQGYRHEADAIRGFELSTNRIVTDMVPNGENHRIATIAPSRNTRIEVRGL